MPDTVRTISALLTTLFQDGQIATISAQRLRDLIVTFASATSIPGADKRILLYGDSISANNVTISTAAWPSNQVTFNAEGYFTWANRLLGHCFFLDPNLVKAVSGETTTQILARYTTDIVANYANFDVAIVQAGSNDLSGATTTTQMDAALANIQTIVSLLQTAGKSVILLAIPPRANIASDATSRKLHQYLNTSLRRYAGHQPAIIFIDNWRDLADPQDVTGAPLASRMAVDGTHPNAQGAYYMGKRIAGILAPLFPPSVDFLASAADVYDATANKFGNLLPNSGFLTGTGGSLSGTTGVVVGSATLQKLSGTFTSGQVVGSVENQTAGYGALPGNKQVITVNISSGNTGDETWQLVQSTTGPVAGDIITAGCEVDFPAQSRLKTVEVRIGESDNVSFPVSASDGYSNLYGGLLPEAASGVVLRTPVYTVQGNSRTFYVSVLATHDASAAGATATIKIGGLFLRKMA